MGERRPDFQKLGTFRESTRVRRATASRNRSLVESVLEAEGTDPAQVLSPKQLRKLRQTSQAGLPIGRNRAG
jgi:hypothetical protein